MTKSKLIAERITQLPDGFLDILSDRAKTQTYGYLPSCIALSYDNRYVMDEKGTPLLFIWAHRNSFLSRKLELCMITTKYFSKRHVREAKALVKEWLSTQSFPVYARCNAQVTKRFLEFMGFEQIDQLDGVTQYKAVI